MGVEGQCLLLTVVFNTLQHRHHHLDTVEQLRRFCNLACLGVKHDHPDESSVEARFEMLNEELARNETVSPHLDHCAVVEREAELGESHVQLVHAREVFTMLPPTFFARFVDWRRRALDSVFTLPTPVQLLASFCVLGNRRGAVFWEQLKTEFR